MRRRRRSLWLLMDCKGWVDSLGTMRRLFITLGCVPWTRTKLFDASIPTSWLVVNLYSMIRGEWLLCRDLGFSESPSNSPGYIAARVQILSCQDENT